MKNLFAVTPYTPCNISFETKEEVKTMLRLTQYLMGAQHRGVINKDETMFITKLEGLIRSHLLDY